MTLLFATFAQSSLRYNEDITDNSSLSEKSQGEYWAYGKETWQSELGQT